MRLASFVEAVALAGGEHEMRALGRQPLGHRKPDADAAAGDDGDLAAESEIRAPSPAPCGAFSSR